jgi:thiol-disulfide isomerase/thioredoxin
MKNSIIISAILIVVAVVGFSAYTFSQNSSKSESMMKKDEAMMKKDDSAVEDKKMMSDKMAGSRYVQYSKSALDSASGNRRVLFFYASWCPTCKPADASFTQNVSKIPEDVTLIRVNYSDPDTDQEEKDLAKKYTVTYQHTFVQIDGAGKEITKWNGGQMDELLSNIK